LLPVTDRFCLLLQETDMIASNTNKKDNLDPVDSLFIFILKIGLFKITNYLSLFKQFANHICQKAGQLHRFIKETSNNILFNNVGDVKLRALCAILLPAIHHSLIRMILSFLE
jgi:hypothetical protein